MAGEDKDELQRRALMSAKAVGERWHKIANSSKYNGHDVSVMNEMEVIDASIGPPAHSGFSSPGCLASTVSRLLISEKYGNLNGVMHGGAAGVIFDMLTTIALAPLSMPGYWEYEITYASLARDQKFLGGVSRTLNISYLKAIPVGTTVLVHAHVCQNGRTMSFIRGWMTSVDGKVVYATCEHHKVAVPSKKEHLEHEVEWDKQWKKKKPEESKL